MHRHNHFRENPMMDSTSVEKIHSQTVRFQMQAGIQGKILTWSRYFSLMV